MDFGSFGNFGYKAADAGLGAPYEKQAYCGDTNSCNGGMYFHRGTSFLLNIHPLESDKVDFQLGIYYNMEYAALE